LAKIIPDFRIDSIKNNWGGKAMGTNLKGKSAVVTGGGSAGIGGAVSSLLAAEGAGVVVADIAKDASGKYMADLKVEAIKKAGGKAVACYDDITTMQGGENIVKTCVGNFGKIDILVNVAGNFWLVPTVEMTEKQWDSIIAVHLKGTFACTKAALPEMIKQKHGRIICFSSRGAFNGPAAANLIYTNVAYNAVKAGILGFVAALAGEQKNNGITVNSILPSAITPLFPSDKKPLEDNLPVPQKTGPEYVAPMVAYLCTDEAQKITGQFFYSGGGDICIFGRPLRMPGPHTLIHNEDIWTIERLKQIIPEMMGLVPGCLS
jgi:NAD(P)-dependent dehydrogenase (short-subunit alcohol dehydrogenase family)